MAERWLPISRYPAYEVSDQGRVRRVGPAKGAVVGRILKTPPDSEGYPHCGLGIGMAGERAFVRVHVLVAEAFIGPIPKRGQVHHLNRVRSDCRASNLEIVSRWEHGERHRAAGSDLRREGEPNPWILCACRCGQKIRLFDRFGRRRRVVQGHGRRKVALA